MLLRELVPYILERNYWTSYPWCRPEGGRRAGTENIILDVALGKACEIAEKALRDTK